MRESIQDYDGALVGNPSTSSTATPSRLTIAHAWTSAQRARDRYFGEPLGRDPAWDILLALYISFAENQKECVKGICLASSAPATTVCRWIFVLEERGLVVRTPDPRDKRRVLLSLAPQGLERMNQALDACAESDTRHGIGRLRVVK